MANGPDLKIDSLTTKVTEIQSKIDNASEAEIDALKTEINDTKKSIDDKKTEFTGYLTTYPNETANINAAIAKLDELSESLIGFADELETLRNSVNTTPPTSTETVDNTSDFSSIDTKIEELKVMTSELKTIIDEYKKEKRSMSEADKTAKEKEINEKKTAIETKKKEIQELIDKIKKGRKDFKFDDIQDADMKAELKKQKEEEEKKLVGLQKELDNLMTPASTTGERIRNVSDKARKRAKRNPWAAGGVLVGAGLLVAWIAGAFKRKKKKNAEGDDNENNDGKKKEKGRFRRNRWKLLLGGVGARALRKVLFGKKNTDENAGEGTGIPGTLRNIENGVDSFEDIDNPTTKENLNKVGTSVNEFFTGIYKFNDGTVPTGTDTAKLGEANFDKYPGVIPHIIDNSFTNIDTFVSQSGLMWLSVDATVDDITKAFGDMIAGGLEKLVGFILGTVGLSGTNVNMEGVREFLSGPNKREDVIKIRQMVYKTFTYVNYAENAYMRKKIYEEVKRGKAIRKRDSDDGTWEVVEVDNADDLLDGELFGKMELHPENYKVDETTVAQFKKEIREGKISKIPTLGITNADIEKYNKPLYGKIKEFNDERDARQTEVVSDKNATLDKLANSADSQLQESFREGARRNLPLLNLFGGDASRAKDAFKETTGYKELLSKYQQKFAKLKTEQDMAKVKYEIDMYYVALKELATVEYAIGEAIDENGNTGVSIVGRFTAFLEGSLSNIILGFNQIINADGTGDVMMGLFNIGTGAGSLYLVYYAIRHPLKTGRFVLKKITQVGGFTGSLIGRHMPVNLIPDMWLKNYYKKNPKYLAYDYATGNISTEKANRVLKKMNQNNGNIFELLKEKGIFGQTNPDEVALFLTKNNEYLENNKIRKAIFDKNSHRRDRLNKKDNTIIEIEHTLYKKLKNIDDNLKALGDASKMKFCKEMVKNAEISDVAEFLDKMDNYTKSDKFKNLDISKMTNTEIRDLARKVGKNMDNLSSADDIADYIDGLNGTNPNITPNVGKINNVIDVADPAIMKNTVVSELNTSRNVKGYPAEFDAGGKLDDPKYASFKKEYEDVLANNPGSDNATKELRKQKYAEIDKKLADQLIADKHPMVSDILEANKSAKLIEFEESIQRSVTKLESSKIKFSSGSPSDGRAIKSIEKQISDLGEIEAMTSTMKVDELDEFAKLYKVLKTDKPTVMNDITKTREKAQGNEKLMKALSEGDGAELKRLKIAENIDISDDVIKVFSDIKVKKVAKILASDGAEEGISLILKVFARLS